jgi:hypothetical protein
LRPVSRGESIIEAVFQGHGAAASCLNRSLRGQRAQGLSSRVARLLVATLIWAAGAAGFAQQSQPPAPDAPMPQQQPPQQNSNPMTAPISNSVDMFLTLQRKSLVFPDLATENRPLSSFEKLKLAANNTVSLSSVGAAVIGAAYGQAVDHPGGWGQGWGAYGQRLGGGMARIASYNIFGNYVIASLTHEDPRFYVRKNLNFGQSVGYAAKRLVITRSDSGDEVVNYSGLLGPLAGETLANVYYPTGSKGVGSTAIRYSTDIGWRFAGYLLRQYWPEINRRLQTAP